MSIRYLVIFLLFFGVTFLLDDPFLHWSGRLLFAGFAVVMIYLVQPWKGASREKTK